MKRDEVREEIERTDRLVNEVGDYISYGIEPDEELAEELEHYDRPEEALEEFSERRFQLSEMLRKNPKQEEFEDL